MKTLKFRPHLCDEILAGNKTVTWRIFDDKNLSAGDNLALINKDTREHFADAKITSIELRTIGTLTGKDYEEHGAKETPDATLDGFREYYGDQVTLDTPLKIVRFKLTTK